MNHYHVKHLGTYHKTNGMEQVLRKSSENKNKLTVKLLLKVIGYGLKFAELIGMDVHQLEKGVLGQRVLEAIINGEDKEPHSLEHLALAVEIIACVGKELTDSTELREKISVSSLMFSLSVDYLSEKANNN